MKTEKQQLQEIMRSRVECLLKQFHNKKMNLEQLNAELLAINPHMYNTMESTSYEKWINKNIVEYSFGNVDLLSITASTSILNALEDDEDDEDDY